MRSPQSNVKSNFVIFNWVSFFIAAISSGISYMLLDRLSLWQDLSFLQKFHVISFQYSYFFLITMGLICSLWVCLSILTNKNKLRIFVASLTVGFVILVFLVADFHVYSIYRSHINIAMLQMTFLGGGKIVNFSEAMREEICLIIILLLLMAISILYIGIKLKKQFRTSVFIFSLSAIIFISNNLVHALAAAVFNTNITSLSDKVPLLKPFTMSRFLEKHGIISKSEIQKQSLNINPSGRNMRYPLNELICKQESKKKNIVFLFIDTLRADMFDPEIMPNLTAFGKENSVFVNHFSNGNNTRHGIFSLFTGIPGSYWWKALSSSTPSVLITTLQKKDYEIGIFAGAPLNLPEFHTTIFSTVKDLRIWPRGEGAVQSDQFAIDDFESWVKKSPKDKPFFSFIFLDTVHAYDFPKTPENEYFKPYWKNINHMQLNNDFDPTEYLNTYKNSVRYADTMIQRVLDFLKKEELLDDTIIVISSDHGDEFNDNKLNYWSHGGNFTNAQIKVPLVIHWPGKPKGVFNYQTSLLDLVPTILPEVLGCINPTSDYSVGQNIWDPNRKRNWFYSSGYDRNAFVEPDRIVLINKAGIMEFLDKTYRSSKDKSIPSYMNEVLEETSRFAK